MSMICLLNSYRYVPDLSPYQPPHALLQWPITHCQSPTKQYLCTSALFLLHHLNDSCIFCFKTDYYRSLLRFKIRYATGVHASLVRRSATLSLLIERNYDAGVENALNDVTFITSFLTTSHLVQNLNFGDRGTHTDSNVISKTTFFVLCRKEDRYLYLF